MAASLPAVGVRLLQRVVWELKWRWRARRARRFARLRVSITVACRDVMWSLDATHLGREVSGEVVEGQAVRDVATTRTLALSVGVATDTDDAIRVLEEAARQRGGRHPLVVVTDNGPPYTSEAFERFLDERCVLHLRSLPYTPQHNPWVEHGNRDLKEESGLGKGVIVLDHEAAARRLSAALDRIDGARLRARLGYRTARDADAEMGVLYDESVRDRLADDVCRRVAQGMNGQMTRRQERVLRREAILAGLEELGLIERTRGGRPMRAVKQEDFS